MGKQETLLTSLVLFILLGFVAMFIGSYATEAVGVSGIFGSIIFLVIFFVMMAVMGRQKLTAKAAIWFIVFGIAASFASGFIGTAIGVTDQLMTNMLFLVVLFVALWYMGKGRTVGVGRK